MNYPLEEVPGTEYSSLEKCQQGFIVQLARLLADLIRNASDDKQPLSPGPGRDTMGSKPLEVDNV